MAVDPKYIHGIGPYLLVRFTDLWHVNTRSVAREFLGIRYHHMIFSLNQDRYLKLLLSRTLHRCTSPSVSTNSLHFVFNVYQRNDRYGSRYESRCGVGGTFFLTGSSRVPVPSRGALVGN